MKHFFILILAVFLLAGGLQASLIVYAKESEVMEILSDYTLKNEGIKVSKEFSLSKNFDSLQIELILIEFFDGMRPDILNIKLKDGDNSLSLSFSYDHDLFGWPIFEVAVEFCEDGKEFEESEFVSEKIVLMNTKDLEINIKNLNGQYQIFINGIEFSIKASEEMMNFNTLIIELISGDPSAEAPLVIEITKINLFYTEYKEKETNEDGDTNGGTGEVTGDNDNTGNNINGQNGKNIANYKNTEQQRPLMLDIAAGLLGAVLIVFLAVKIGQRIKVRKQSSI